MSSDIHDLLDRLRARFLARLEEGPGAFTIGVTGGVAVGKTTFAEFLAGEMRHWPARPHVEIVSTDGFLHPNRILAERQLSYRKGFPESYDLDALIAAIDAIHAGRPVGVPRYSHVTYDVDLDNVHHIGHIDVAIVDGLHLGHVKHDPRGAALLDTLIYLDADEEDIEHWFRNRLFPLMVAGRDDPKSFYHSFRHLDEEAVLAFIQRVWAGINLPNLREHIINDRDVADVVVRKARDHSVVSVRIANSE
jgi:type I pantothenate kinase